jgi:hypothetical protein
MYGGERIRSDYNNLFAQGRLRPIVLFVPEENEAILAEIRLSAIAEGATEDEAAQHIDALRQAAKTAPSCPQLIIDGFANEVVRAIELQGRYLRTPVYAGEYPTGAMNACITKSPSGIGWLILVNTGLMLSLWQAVKVHALAMNFVEDDGHVKVLPARQPGWTCEQISRALAEIAFAYFTGDVTQATRYSTLAGRRLVMLERYVSCAERFIIAHEFAHLIAGHLQEAAPAVWRTPKGNLPVVNPLQEREFEADEIGLSLTFALPKEIASNKDRLFNEMSGRIAGPVFYFQLSELFNTIGVKVFRQRDPSVSTHPSPTERGRRLIDLFAERYGGEVTNNARDVVL